MCVFLGIFLLLFCAGQTWRGFTEEISIMFTTAKEIWGLPGRHWFVGWDTPASLQLTSALVHLSSVLNFLFFILVYHFMNAAKTVMDMLRVFCLFMLLLWVRVHLSNNWWTQLEQRFVRLLRVIHERILVTLQNVWGFGGKNYCLALPSLQWRRGLGVELGKFAGCGCKDMTPWSSDLSPAGMIVQTMVFFLCLLIAVFVIIIPVLHRQNLIFFQILWSMWWASSHLPLINVLCPQTASTLLLFLF